MSSSSKKWLIAAVAVSPLLLLVVAYFNKRNLGKEPTITKQHVDESRQRLSVLTYDPVEDTEKFRARFESLPVVSNYQLSGVERDALSSCLYDLTMAFHKGTYEAFRQFRTPIDANFSSKAISYHFYVLTNFYLKGGQTLPSGPEEITKRLWELNYDGNAFSHYFEGMSLDNIQTKVEKTNSLPENLFSYAVKADNLGVREIVSTFEFPRSASAILKKTGSLKYATVTLPIKPSPPDPVFPVFVRFYWDDQTQKWLPWEMCSGNSQKRKRDPMF